MNKSLTFLLITFSFLLSQCIPFEEEKLTEIHFDLSDPVLQQLYTFQDKHLGDSLLPFFNDKNPSYRYAAALAFGSIKDKQSTQQEDSLIALLKDEVAGVRLAAAYSIGQLKLERAENALIEAFRDTVVVSPYLRKIILEAVGKSATPQYQQLLATVPPYSKTDTLLLEGQAWGLYRFALRDIVSQEGTDQMAGFITTDDYPSSVRLIAANYLARTRNISIDSFAVDLARAFRSDDDYRFRNAMAIVLGKSKQGVAKDALLEQFEKEDDYRVKCNIIRALQNFDYTEVQATVLAALDDPNFHISNTASGFFVEAGIPIQAVAYWQKARDDTTLHWLTKINLYTAANKLLPLYFQVTKGRINQELKDRFTQSTNPYEKGAALKALAEFGWNYRYIKEQGFAVPSSPVRTAAVEALAKIAKDPGFNTFFGLGRRQVKTELGTYFKEAIQSGDVGMMAEAAGVLATSELDYKSVIDDPGFLVNAQLGLRMPKDIETYNVLQEAIDYFNGASTTVVRKPEWNQPLDWQIISEVNEDTRAVMETTKGNIELLFYKQAAPGTVANFIQLARTGFYEGKNFHRVVSNFVVQGGCPRGDGYGSLNYTIRSELPPMNYDDEGYVGMASAGNHTECNQFFITHSPTPHLDGNYTIFARVDRGMEVVHQLEIGDQINRVLINN